MSGETHTGRRPAVRARPQGRGIRPLAPPQGQAGSSGAAGRSCLAHRQNPPCTQSPAEWLWQSRSRRFHAHSCPTLTSSPHAVASKKGVCQPGPMSRGPGRTVLRGARGPCLRAHPCPSPACEGRGRDATFWAGHLLPSISPLPRLLPSQAPHPVLKSLLEVPPSPAELPADPSACRRRHSPAPGREKLGGRSHQTACICPHCPTVPGHTAGAQEGH